MLGDANLMLGAANLMLSSANLMLGAADLMVGAANLMVSAANLMFGAPSSSQHIHSHRVSILRDVMLRGNQASHLALQVAHIAVLQKGIEVNGVFEAPFPAKIRGTRRGRGRFYRGRWTVFGDRSSKCRSLSHNLYKIIYDVIVVLRVED